MHRRSFLVVSIAAILTSGCAGSAATTTTTTSPSATTAPAPPTLELGGLVPADPATLVPFEDAESLVVGERHDGAVSPNGRWAVVRTTGEEAMTELTLIELDGLVSTPIEGEGIGLGPVVDDAGRAHFFATGLLTWVSPDATGVIETAPSTPDYLTDTLTDLGDGRVAYLTGSETERGPISVVIVSGEAVTVHEIAGVTVGPQPSAEPDLPHRELVVPAVAFDGGKDLATIVAADEDVIVVVDLVTGATTEHTFTSAPWPDDEPAERDVFISDDGSTLFVATSHLLVEPTGDGWETTESAHPLVVIDTRDWTSRAIESVIASNVYPSPDRSIIATSGAETVTESDGHTETTQSPVYVIEVAASEPLVGFEGRSGTIEDVQFSGDGAEMYVLSTGEDAMNIDIVDMAALELVGSVGFTRMSLVGEAGLMAFHLTE
jgi:hypothetical protein